MGRRHNWGIPAQGHLVNRLLTLWDYLRTSLWFLPALMSLVGLGLSVLCLSLDSGAGGEDRVRSWWVYGGNGEDARNILSTLLAAVLTMAGVIFSITVVALTLAANQYGPRLVRGFRLDLRNQATLGIFVLTIVYLLSVLRMVRSEAAFAEVPHLSVTVGTVLAFTCVLSLIGFVQVVAGSIVADEIVRRVARELDEAIAKLPDLENEQPDADALLPMDFETNAVCVPVSKDGYVQAVDYPDLIAWAHRHDAILRLEFRPGDFVVEGDRRMWVYPARQLTDEDTEALRGAIEIGTVRTPTQDLEFSIRHLVEVAVRALSPGVNDPYTAIAAIDRLRGALTRILQRRLLPEHWWDDSGRLRIVAQASTYAGILDAAFHQIRQAGASMPAIVIHMLEALARIAEHAPLEDQRRALARHARMVADAGLRETEELRDRQDIETSYRRAVDALRHQGPDEPEEVRP